MQKPHTHFLLFKIKTRAVQDLFAKTAHKTCPRPLVAPWRSLSLVFPELVRYALGGSLVVAPSFPCELVPNWSPNWSRTGPWSWPPFLLGSCPSGPGPRFLFGSYLSGLGPRFFVRVVSLGSWPPLFVRVVSLRSWPPL